MNYDHVIAFWNESGTIILHSENICGTTTTEMEVTVSLEGGCDPCQIMQTYPNPSSTELTVTFKEGIGTALENSELHSEIVLINSNMRIVYSVSTSDLEIKIPTSAFPEGLYYLNAKNKLGTETKQILVKH